MFVFFSSRKTSFKMWLNTSSTPGGSIEKAPASSIAFRHLVDRSSFCSCVFALFLDTFSIVAFVDVVFLDTSICRELLRIYIYALRDPILISSISLDLSAPIHLPNTLSFTSNLFLKQSSRLIKFSFT